MTISYVKGKTSGAYMIYLSAFVSDRGVPASCNKSCFSVVSNVINDGLRWLAKNPPYNTALQPMADT